MAAEILEPAFLVGQVEGVGEGGPIVVGIAVALGVLRPRIAQVGTQEVGVDAAIEQFFVDIDVNLQLAAARNRRSTSGS